MLVIAFPKARTEMSQRIVRLSTDLVSHTQLIPGNTHECSQRCTYNVKKHNMYY